MTLVLLVTIWLPAAPLPEEGEAARARKNLIQAVESRSNDQVKTCLAALVRAGGRENIEAILRILPGVPEAEDEIYWDLIQGACSFSDREAMEHLGETLLRFRGAARARDLIFGLARNRSPSVVFALAPVMEKGALDLKLMAAEKIGTIFAPESVDALIAQLKVEERTDSELRDVIVEGLQGLTGQHFEANWVNWDGWWQKNRDKPLQGGRKPEEDRGTGTVVDKLDRKRARGFAGLEKASKKSVIVLSAEFPERDLNNGNIERVLESMGIPHEVVKRPDFEKYDLRGVGAILINCAQFHEFCICPTCKPSGTKENRLYKCDGCDKHKKFSGKLSAGAIKKIQAFVSRGGYLFCEDWTVKEVVERAFPQYVSAGKVLKQGTADVVPARGRVSHPLLKGIFKPERPAKRDEDDDDDGDSPGGTVARKPEPDPEGEPELVKVKHQWVIDDESWALRISDSAKVVTLLQSGRLQKTTEGEGVVALYFRPGGEADSGSRRQKKGLVMQVLSHFGKQESADDEYTLQNLLVNFLIDANVARTRDELPQKKSKDKKASPKGKEPGKEGEPAPAPEGEEGKTDSGEES